MSEEELLQQAQNEANTQAEQEALAARQAFMSQYGNRFGGDEPIGLAILNNLNERGIDVSAADSAVQEIINKLREESNHILEATQEYVNQLSQQAQAQQVAVKQLEADTAAAQLALNDKLNVVSDAVTGAAAATGDPALAQGIAAGQAEPIINSDTGMPPLNPPMEQAPVEPAPEAPPVEPAPETPPAEPAPEAPPVEPAPEAPPAPGPTSPFNPMNQQQPSQGGAVVSSDERLKTIKARLHSVMSKRNTKPQGIHLASNIISACGR